MSGAPPLDGVRVLDFTAAMAGPDCSMLLADFGAEVIKVEPLKGEGSRNWGNARFGESGEFSGLYLALNRNKASVTLNLKSEEGKHAAAELVRTADVVMESFTPGVADRLGIGYDDVVQIKPDVIYCSISGFGQTGPLRDRPGYDQLLQAYAGHLSVTGEPDRPSVRIGPSAIDLLTGAHAALGIVMALFERQRSGEGQRLETSLYDSSLHLVTHFIADYTGSGKLQRKVGGGFAFLAPYGMYAASDGEFYMGVGSDRMFARLCEAIDRPELVNDPRFVLNGDRVAHRDALDAELAVVFAREPAERWVALCFELGIPTSLVCDISEVAEQEHAAAREMIVKTGIENVRSAGIPIKLSRTPGRLRTPPPSAGADNDRILDVLSKTGGASNGNPASPAPNTETGRT
ncbi:MAG TPA: CoA transferase [Solirubrobacteraceae bacterium]|nr:CoA transferase [Solirubrobacteraceae bacterium]